ncbi:ubiquinol-cytochrome c reductase iron-sulfur subunit [Thiohalobacter sp. COW1]|uniref:Ubiquinol-cytochrome c reductase iron-sulfur subunit n=1 Tax=Thiohalobacter thiocyanaticus TaxID=585455 RepID=A0A1Z4VTV3_9GAMM|nr:MULTISPECIES: ubiquinol-cytochrome c reductase iron-sulfur subunit [Thiohalobacter]BAZ94915.1 ubiquinol-cytochrome c reductase, iron-sulfur subunit [Thiohalobacter thiocyanaticus]BCO33172.1 ubiquinol-cytochrome c reductase iron-sulfur subunit [Thiohalobacter sp. COW1]
MSDGVDTSRRRFLTAATSVVGAVGAVYVAVPFVKSMWPSARAQAAGAPVEVDISKIEPGQMLNVEWRGKPVWIVNRTDEMLQSLDELTDRVSDPDSQASEQPEYAQNQARSIKENVLVMVAICTHLGCSPKYRPDVAPADLGNDWLGGFFCPCHGSKYDLAGRVYKGMPAPLNMPVPPHRYIGDTVVLVGEDQGAA